MEVVQTKLADVWLIKPDINTDFRGDYSMVYNKDLYKWVGLPEIDFVEHDISTSMKGVLRGIHYSPNCWKLNECLYGSIYYVVVNCEEGHPEFGKWEAFILDDKKRWQIFKHPRYGTGFYVLSDFAIFHYLQSQYYDPNNPDQKTFPWWETKVWWPDKNPMVSRRDELGHYENSTD